MEDVLKKGYAEKVPEDSIDGASGKLWYIPHHGVYHPRKPGKIRVVFDCAARHQGTSLNDVLLSGPDLTNSLVGILLKFRQEPVAVMADIESMYYRVKVPVEDRNFLRFFWWPDGNYDEDPSVYRMTVHLFGAVSSASCATYALQQTASDNIDAYDQEVVEMVKDSFYVDDCLASLPDEEKATQVVKDVTNLCQEGGFRLTKWISNSHRVMMSIPEEERAKEARKLNLELEGLPSERALGVYWTVESDTLGFKITLKDQPNTRRGILSVVSSVYDPLGFASPFILSAKQILQGLCEKNLDWDEEIDDKSLKTWKQWLADLPKLEGIELSRCYKPKNFGEVTDCQLHMFSDASDIGYGVTSYLRLVNSKNQVHCCLVMSKSRVAPLKKVTTPRMELTAATVAVRLYKVLTNCLQYKLDKVCFWTDSMSVLRYIRNNTSRFKTFVANRVTVIREGSLPEQWGYVSSQMNPADCASRGANFAKFQANIQWFDGPDFLWKTEAEWPDQKAVKQDLPEDDPEVKKQSSCACVEKEPEGMTKLLCYYSSWTKLKRSVGWFILFVRQLKERNHKAVKTRKMKDESENMKLTQEILQSAEIAIIKCVQAHHFSKEITILKENTVRKEKKQIPRSSALYKLNAFMKNGVLCVGGRLDRAKIDFEQKHQVILPKNSHVSALVLNEAHKDVGHMGRNSILSHVRLKYWVLGAGKEIKRLMSKCTVCRRYQTPVGEQQMADLPKERVEPGLYPFTHTGMDFFGPFMVKRGRCSVKRYGVIFTCLTMRAIHLEVASSLDTDSCINAVRRFIARRGVPKTIRSDNGTNLVGCERELRQSLEDLNQSKIHSVLLNQGVDWHFNAPAASHHGGVWERLIRSVRKILFSIIQSSKLDDESLNTLFCEVEKILNNRPLTEVSSDVNDIEPLTPNHLLILRTDLVLPGLFRKGDSLSRRRWRHVQYLADLFWSRWVKEYLPLLQERQKWVHKRRNLHVGDIVLLMDSSPRSCWSLGRVTDVQTDRKGCVRVVKVKTATNELTRPIDKLCLIVAKD